MIRPALQRTTGTWADFGAGTGVFTRALADLLDPSATILAIDRDPSALERLGGSYPPRPDPGPVVVPILADFRDLGTASPLEGWSLDGALFANALHFVPDPRQVLERLRARLTAGARVVVVEYGDRPPSRWVPYPIPVATLQGAAEAAGLRFLGVVAERPSLYGGALYAAVLENPESAPASS